ncbi:phosphoglycerate kinase, partial [bacterium]|nr:phosphoglycerate kinase [bacterium]
MCKKIQDIKNLVGKRVLLKLDLNLSFDKNNNLDHDNAFRIEKSLEIIRYLVRKNARVIIISYLGRPNGKFVQSLKMDIVAKILSKYLKQDIQKMDSAQVEDIKVALEKIENGQILMLENIRFYPGESKNDQQIAKNLAELFDLYINDSFSNAHRKHMSAVAITKYLPSYMGFRFQEEINNLKKSIAHNYRHKILILGGNKVDTKLALIEELSNKFDNVLLGGVLANTLLKSRGFNIGKSVYSAEMLNFAKKIDNQKIILPKDVVVASKNSEKAKSQTKKIADLSVDDIILDIGEETIAFYKKKLEQTETILWNGPLGYFEINKYRQSTRKLILAIQDYNLESYI